MKIFLTILTLLFLTACSNQPLGGELTLQQKIDAKIADIQSLMETDKQSNGKYKQRLTAISDGIESRVDEYEKPNGDIGYWITLKKEDANGIYQKVIATGVDQKLLEYDWKLIQPAIIATSTK